MMFNGEEKAFARQKIIDLFRCWPTKLKLLTLPGPEWQFERELLERRNLPTNIIGVEYDRILFAAAKKNKPHGCKLLFANIDNIMTTTDDAFDAVWLDYHGLITSKRLTIIKRFYYGFIRSTLILTMRRGRGPLEIHDAIDRAGGHSRWLKQHFAGHVLHNIEYCDTAAMIQFAVRHRQRFWI
jgi:hypothetical protein